MKKSHIIILILVIMVVEFIGYAVYDIYHDPNVPNYGEWYCEELKIGIVFHINREVEAKRYMDDGSYENLEIYSSFDWLAYGIYEHGESIYNDIIHGDSFWHKNTFAIRDYDDGQIYKFVLVEK